MPPDQQHVYQVSELTSQVRLLLESSYPNVLVEGEISNLATPASGHLYFSLKDDKSQIRCAFFRNRRNRLNTAPEDGMQVCIGARVSLYEHRGDFQLIVHHIEQAGLGNLQIAFDKLKQALKAEGLFDSNHKQPLPRFPDTIGVITSDTGAVIEDILSTCKRRYPIARIQLYPVPVQGKEAARLIAAALNKADKSKTCDVLIVGRGGGSLEDLWAFNEQIVARAIFACQTPVISAVGHDTDFTISDFVADLRAPTPTAAAELATPDWRQVVGQFQQLEKRLRVIIKTKLIHRVQYADMLARRLIHPSQRLASRRELNTQLYSRLNHCIRGELHQHNQHYLHLKRLLYSNSPAKMLCRTELTVSQYRRQLGTSMQTRIRHQTEKLAAILARLLALSPQSTLERGYAIVTTQADKSILRTTGEVKPGLKIRVRLADGSFNATSEE